MTGGLCHMCKRVIRPTDGWRVSDAGYKVHQDGFCRGPLVKRFYMVGYKGSEPASVARLPDTLGEIEAHADELIGRGFEVRLRRMTLKALTGLIGRMAR